MHWGITYYTKKYGYICTRLPLSCYGKWWCLYLYCSPDGTPSNSTYFLGKKLNPEEYAKARLRKFFLGHNFNPNTNKSTVQAIKYFYPGHINETIDIIRRSKAEIKAFSINSKVRCNEILISDINRYLDVYGGKRK